MSVTQRSRERNWLNQIKRGTAVTTTSRRRDQIVDSLRDKEYRDAFVASQANKGIAFQIRAIRERSGWTQMELGQRSGNRQETISMFEKSTYGRYSLNSLLKLASAFDVALIVRFAPFSQLADWVTDLSPEDLAVPSFQDDPGLRPPEQQAGGFSASTAGSLPAAWSGSTDSSAASIRSKVSNISDFRSREYGVGGRAANPEAGIYMPEEIGRPLSYAAQSDRSYRTAQG